LSAFIYSLGIRHVGIGTAQNISEVFGSIKGLLNAKQEDLENIKDLGVVVSASILDYFSNTVRRNEVFELIKLGIHPQKKSRQLQLSLSGKIFVLTGTLPNMTRQEASAIITENGGKISTSVSKKIDYLLAGSEAGSKLEKAKKLGLNIISEKNLILLISN